MSEHCAAPDAAGRVPMALDAPTLPVRRAAMPRRAPQSSGDSPPLPEDGAQAEPLRWFLLLRLYGAMAVGAVLAARASRGALPRAANAAPADPPAAEGGGTLRVLPGGGALAAVGAALGGGDTALVLERVRGRHWFLPVLICAGMVAGTILVAWAYADAAVVGSDQLHYHLFWLGVLAFLLPIGARLCGEAAARSERMALLAAAGAFTCLPKYLRTPGNPLFHDELAHWRSSELGFMTGHLFLPNPSVYISQFFPGLQAMTVALRDLTGLSTFQVGTALIVSTHIAALLGIAALAERLTGSVRIAGVAAFLYALNPGFMFFDTQYSYESVAFVLVIWAIVAVVSAHETAADRPRRLAWLGIGLTLAAACIITHHVSSYVLVGFLWLLTAATWLWPRLRGTGRGDPLVALVTLAVTAAALAWLLLVAPEVLAYLTEPIRAALRQLGQLLEHRQHGRTLFARSTTPGYERLSAFAAVVAAGLGACGGLLLRWRLRIWTAAGTALCLFGLLYFASMPAMLTGSGNEGARRSWTFSYLGLCLLIAPAIVWLLHRGAVRGRLRGVLATAGVIGLLGIVTVGNVSMNINELYRFPGPYIYGSDTRSTTAELLDTTQWIRTTQGTGRAVVADRYVSQILSSFGLEWTPLASARFPVWQLYLDPRAPSPELLRELRDSDYRYLVVDERMARYLPYLGAYFQDGEKGQVPPARVVIDRFADLPWATKIYASDNLSVYRLNLADFGLRAGTSQGRQG